MSNKKSNVVSFTYNGKTTQSIFSTKSMSNATMFNNKVNAIKYSKAFGIVSNNWLENNIITLENCVVREDGSIAKIINPKTLSESLNERLEKEVEEVANNIIVSN